MEAKVVSFSKRNGRDACEVHAISDWEGFEKLVRFLENNYSATVLDRFDGPDARRWILDLNGVKVEVQYEHPWGNLIAAADERGDDLVVRIGKDLGSRLAGVHDE